MTVELKPLNIEKAEEAFDDEYSHLVCHCDNYSWSLCGKDVTDSEWDYIHESCPMCEIIDSANDYVCPRCGCEGCPE